MKTKQCLVIVMTLLCLCVKAQNLRVTGVVRDKSDVIIGASVMVKNSTVGTVTDMDGRYSVEVPANGVLIFSYIGYTPVEKQVDGQTVINVTMNDDVQAIDEVVVTAIGIKQQKKKLGYTTQQVNTEALDQPGTVNVAVPFKTLILSIFSGDTSKRSDSTGTPSITINGVFPRKENEGA